MRNKHRSILLVLLCLAAFICVRPAVVAASDESSGIIADTKEAGKEVGKAGKEVGKAVKDAVSKENLKETGGEIKEAGKETGQALKEAGQETKDALKETGHEIKEGIKNLTNTKKKKKKKTKD